jgi:hypothetical protein
VIVALLRHLNPKSEWEIRFSMSHPLFLFIGGKLAPL